MQLDGSSIGEIIHWINNNAQPADVGELEKMLGQAVPGELREFLKSPVRLSPPSTKHPEIEDERWAGWAPDFDKWFHQLALPFEGEVQCLYHFCGLYPLGLKEEDHGPVHVMAALEAHSYSSGRGLAGGVAGFDDRELFKFAPSISKFLVLEVNGEGNEGGFLFAGGERIEADELPPTFSEAWDKHFSRLRFASDRRWVTTFLRADNRPQDLGLVSHWLPSLQHWEADKGRLERSYADAMFWLVALTLLDYPEERADAVRRTSEHRSPIVAGLSKYIGEHPDLPTRFASQRRALLKHLVDGYPHLVRSLSK
jgi:hypothetical protein